MINYRLIKYRYSIILSNYEYRFLNNCCTPKLFNFNYIDYETTITNNQITIIVFLIIEFRLTKLRLSTI